MDADADVDPRMDVLEVEGAALAHRIEGHGAHALAIFHGWVSSAAHWDALATQLAATHRVLRWDRRGFGASAGGVAAGSSQRHADDLAALLDAGGIERATIAGHAGGAPGALRFAVEHADRTEALVLFDTHVHRPAAAGEPVPAFARQIDQMCEQLRGPGGDAAMDAFYRSYFGPRAAPALVEAAVAAAVRADRDRAVADLRTMVEDTWSLAARVRCPVLWISAQPGDAAEVAAAFSGTTPWIGHVVGSGHFVQVEVPEQCGAMLAAFLATHDLA